MKARVSLMLAVGCVALLGCQKPSASPEPGTGQGNAQQVSLVYCGKCGHQKDGTDCCTDGCPKCEQCSLHSGSTLCCKIEMAFAGKDLCGTCGHVAGSEECCKDGCEVCGKCGLHAGSPLCCKLANPATEEDVETSKEETSAEG